MLVLVGAHQPVADRHRDPLEAALGNMAQQAAKVDLVERGGRQIGDQRDLQQRGVEHQREAIM